MKVNPADPTTVFLCDVDDVCAGFVQAFNAAVVASGVRDIKPDHPHTEWDLTASLGLTKEEEDRVYALINAPGVAASFSALPGAVEGVTKIASIPSVEVVFVTSELQTSPTWVFDRQTWLVEHFGEEQGKKVINTHLKHRIDGDILLDDKPKHCSRWNATHPFGWALMWSTGRNVLHLPPGVMLVDSWNFVYKFVENFANLKCGAAGRSAK